MYSRDYRIHPRITPFALSWASLKKKGFLNHKKEGQRYIYFATELVANAKLSALEHLLSTFFGGSAPNIVSTLVNLPGSNLTEKELDELSQIIEDAKKEQKK